MTEDDKRQIKANLLLEFQEAEEELAHLVEKAHITVSHLHAIGHVINDARGGTQEMPEKIRLNRQKVEAEPQYRASMDFDGFLDFLKQLDEAKLKVKTLKERKTALGLK